MPHKITNPQLKKIIKEVDDAYMEYIRTMKGLREKIRALVAKQEEKHVSKLRSKIKNLK